MGIFRNLDDSFGKLNSTAKTQYKLAKNSAIGALWAIPYSIKKGFEGATSVFTEIASFGSNMIGHAGLLAGVPIFFATIAVATVAAAATFAASVLGGCCAAAGLAVTSVISSVAAIGSKCIERSVEGLTGETQPPKYRMKSYPKTYEKRRDHRNSSSPSSYPKPTGFFSQLAEIAASIFR